MLSCNLPISGNGHAVLARPLRKHDIPTCSECALSTLCCKSLLRRGNRDIIRTIRLQQLSSICKQSTTHATNDTK